MVSRKRFIEEPLAKGDSVLLKKSPVEQGKLIRPWTSFNEPYKVVEIKKGDAYVIAQPDSKPLTIHRDRLKKILSLVTNIGKWES